MRSSHPGKASWILVMLVSPLSPRANAAVEPDPAGVEAPDVAQLAQVCIINTTGARVQYELKWGGGPWEAFSLSAAPAESALIHHLQVSGSAAAPEVRVRFDSDMTDGERMFEYRLSTKVAAERRCEGAGRYRFEWDGRSRRYIDLRSVD
ncbi:hypothetical protein WMF30_32955 [Sorangium sp. So ce134]